MDLEIEIENEKIGKYILSGEIYFTLGSDGSYTVLPTDDELLDYELYDETGLLFEDTSEKMEKMILNTAIRIYKRDYLEEDETDDWE
tara:strand:- start:162 stop:422 length:261 start_codon:yes stop_codon:yes gene_type:complete